MTPQAKRELTLRQAKRHAAMEARPKVFNYEAMLLYKLLQTLTKEGNKHLIRTDEAMRAIIYLEDVYHKDAWVDATRRVMEESRDE